MESPIGLEVGFVLESCDAIVEAWSCLCRGFCQLKRTGNLHEAEEKPGMGLC